MAVTDRTVVIPRIPADQTVVIPKVKAEFDSDDGPTCGELIKSMAALMLGSGLIGFVVGFLTACAILAFVMFS